jgi:hypothetical protein
VYRELERVLGPVIAAARLARAALRAYLLEIGGWSTSFHQALWICFPKLRVGYLVALSAFHVNFVAHFSFTPLKRGLEPLNVKHRVTFKATYLVVIQPFIWQVVPGLEPALTKTIIIIFI